MSTGKDRRWTGRQGRSAGPDGGAEPLGLIEALYTLSDITAEINGGQATAPLGLTEPDDIGLLDDVIDALQDPQSQELARAALRDTLARIAQHTLGRRS